MFESGKALKFVEEDNWKEGCLPETGQNWEVDIEFKAETKEEILQQIKEFYGVTDEEILLNSCEEPGRIDIQIMEDENSYKATESQIEAWKEGRRKLYLATYTYYITEVNRYAVAL
jgi:hypothetical protein